MSRAAKGPSPYLFLASSPKGGKRLGVRSAASERALASVLGRERRVLVWSRRLPGWLGSSGQMGLKDQEQFNAVLGQLVSRGVPLVEALDVTASAVDASHADRIRRVRSQVAGGAMFADACGKVGIVDPVTSAVYRAAERTGDLGGACGQIAKTAERQVKVRSQAITLMFYPIIVLGVSVLAGWGMLTFIVPMIGSRLSSMGSDLPWFTVALMTAGQTIRDNLGVFFLIVLGLLIATIVLRKAVLAALWNVVRRLPGMRELVLAQETTRFFSVMAAMTRSGVTLADALVVAFRTVSHAKLRRQLQTLQRRLVEGGQLAQLIEDVDALPLPVRKLLIAAERSGDLEEAFESLAEDMADEVERRSTRALAVLEPGLIIFMFLMIGSMVLAIMLPLFTATANMDMG
ncbi:MAG: type II secretion system F family protein [Phycisphaerales bacterium]|jgi:type II secretory pathway component PulF